MSFEIPDTLKNSLSKYEKTIRNLRSIELLVHEYNKTVSSVSKEERSLFKIPAEITEENINHGLTKITWNYVKLEEYVGESRLSCEELKETFNNYKTINTELLDIIEKIRGINFFKQIQIENSIEDLIEFQKNHQIISEKRLMELLTEFNLKIRQVLELTKLESQNQSPYWIAYHKKLFDLLEMTLNSVIESDLDRILDNFSANVPIIKGSLNIEENEVLVKPDEKDLDHLITNTLDNIKCISRICHENENYEIILKMPKKLELVKNKFKKIVEDSWRDSDNYCQIWKKFHYLWDGSATTADILNYDWLLENKILIQTIPDLKQAGIIKINAALLKSNLMTLINAKINVAKID